MLVFQRIKPFNSAYRVFPLEHQKSHGRLSVEHQKSHGRLSEYVVPTIQTVSVAFYVKTRNMKLPHTKETIF